MSLPTFGPERFLSFLAFAGAMGGGLSEGWAQQPEPLPIDSPNGLSATISDFQRIASEAQAQDPVAFIQQSGLMAQLLDHGFYGVNFFGRLAPGLYQNGLEVSGPSSILANVNIREGVMGGQILFSPFVLQHDFPLKDIPFLPSWMPGQVPITPLFSIGIKEGKFYADTPVLPTEIDVTPFITREFMGESQKEIVSTLSELVPKIIENFANRPLPEGQKSLAGLVDAAVSWFNIIVSSDPEGKVTPFAGRAEDKACAEGRDPGCSYLGFHWERIGLGNIAIEGIDLQAVVRTDPETGAIEVRIPKLEIDKISHRVSDDSKETSLSNLRLEDVELELVPKDPNDLTAGMYPTSGKGTIRMSGVSVLGDIEIGSLGSGIDFKMVGDADGNIAADLFIDGLRLKKADLLMQGGIEVHVKDAVLLDDDGEGPHGKISFNLIGGVPSYDASFFVGVESVEAKGTLKEMKLKAKGGPIECRELSAASQNAMIANRIKLTDCKGSLGGAVRLLGKVPLKLKAGLEFDGLEADLTVGPETLLINRVALPNFDLNLGAKGEGMNGTVHLEDGAKRMFQGEEIPAGILLTTAEDGLLTAKINIKDSINLKGPQGTLQTSGPVVGVVNLVNISDDPMVPDFRPVPGSLNLQIEAGVFVNALGQQIVIQGKTTISDDILGHITISNNLWASKPFPLGTSTDLKIDLSQSVKEHNDTPYYDIPDALGLSLVANLREKHIGTVTLTASASITGLKSGDPHAQFKADLPLGPRTIKIPGGEIEIEGGSVRARGTEKQIGVDIQPPNLEFNIVQQIDDLKLQFNGALNNNASFHAAIDPSTGTVSVTQKGQSPALDGWVTVTAWNKAGEMVGQGNIRVDSSYQIRSDSTLDKTNLSLSIPESGLSGHVFSDIVIGDFKIPAGSTLKIMTTGFGGAISLNHKTLAMESVWTGGDIEAELSILGSPLKPFATDLDGPVTVKLGGKANRQQYRLNRAPDGKITFEGVQKDGTMLPYELTVDAKIGEALSALVKGSSKMDGIHATFNPATGELDVAMAGISSLLEIDGKTVMPLNLKDLDSQSLLDRLKLRINTKTGEVKIAVVAPAISGIAMPPGNFEDWMKWTKADWERYRKAMNEGRHLSVLSEGMAGLPGTPIPHGRGKIFVDLVTSEKEYEVDPAKFGGDAQKALSDVVAKVMGDIEMRREYPNPPTPNPMPAESIVYNEGQDTLFFLNSTEADLIPRIQNALGIEEKDARAILQNGRLDLDRLTENPFLKENFSPETIHSLVRAFLDPRSSDANFTKRGVRLLLALEAVRQGQEQMVGFHKTFWSEKVRSTTAHNFDKAESRGRMPEKEGINITAYAYMPYEPEKILSLLSDVGHYSYWLPWIGDDQVKNLEGAREDLGPILSFSFDQKKTGEKLLPTLNGRYLLIPHKKGGTILIQQQAVDFDGPDIATLEGRDEDHSDLADRSRFPLDMAVLLGKTGRALNPVTDPVQVFSGLVNRSVSSLSHILFAGKLVDFRGYKPTPESLTFTPEGIQRTSTPPEFMALDLDPKETSLEKVQALQRIPLKVEPQDKAIVKKMLMNGIGFTEVQADAMIRAGEIDLKILSELDYVKASLAPETVRSMAALLLISRPEVNENFLSRSDRFALFFKDLRERRGEWSDANGNGVRILTYRVYTPADYHRWSPQNKNQGDGNDTVSHIVFPPGASTDKILEALSHPDWFRKFTANGVAEGSGDYREAQRVECATPRKGMVCVDSAFGPPTNLVYRIELPKAEDGLLKIGNVGIAPWWWVQRPGLAGGTESFEENQGVWVVVPMVDGSNLVFRMGLLNSTIQGDAALQETAFKAVAGFLEGVYRWSRSSNAPETIRILYGGQTLTQERYKEWK